MLNRDIAYYGMTETMNSLYKKGKSGERINHLMKIVTSKKNILLAIKCISSNPGRDTRGSDLKTFNEFLKDNNDAIINLIRRKIKWMKPEPNRIIYIPKKNGKKRKLGIGSIIDRIVQQCFLNVLIPITESQFSENSFGFRVNTTTKHAFAKAINGLWKSKRPQYIIDIDLESYFDTIPIEKVLDKLRYNFKICDDMFLKSIKRLIYDNSDNGIGIPQGSVLGPTLSNVLLDDLDRIYDKLIADLPDSKTKGMWKAIDNGSWNRVRNGKPYIRFSRYADDIRITTSTEEQVHEILDITEQWCELNGVKISKEKTHYYNTHDKPEISMVGFRARKGPNGLIIAPAKQKDVIALLRGKVKECKITSNPSMLIVTFIALMNQYDICTNMNWMIKYIEGVLNNTKRGGFKINNTLKLVDGKRIYELPAPNKDGYILFQPWVIRSHTSCSISQYLKKPFVENFDNDTNRTDCKDYLNSIDKRHNGKCIMYLPGLLHRQKFKCFVTGQILTPDYCDIHHKKPSYKGGSDSFTNLVLLSREVHQALHGLNASASEKYKDNKKFQQLQKLIK